MNSLHMYSWLSYSKSLNSRLYIQCVFHLKINHNQVGKCVTSSMIKFKDAIADLRKYESIIVDIFTPITLWKNIIVLLQ